MRRSWVVICLAAMWGVGGTAAPVEAQNAATAERKAHVLEKRIAGELRKPAPSATAKIGKDEVQAVDAAGKGAVDNAITCLSRTIYWEARGDGAAAMEAIANVVMNRLGHQGFPDTVCKVVKAGRKSGVCEFTWWCGRHSVNALDDTSYALAKEISRRALNRQLTDRTGGALYFHQRNVKPSWSRTYLKTARIGHLVFYKPRGATAR